MEIYGKHQYEFAHGRKPRGDGNWAFKVPGQNDLVWKIGTLTQVLKELRQAGYEWVELQS